MRTYKLHGEKTDKHGEFVVNEEQIFAALKLMLLPIWQALHLFKYWHEQEFGSDMEVKPSMKGFGGPYGDFLTSGAGQYFEYKRTGHGRLVVMREQWQAKLENEKPVEQEQEQEEIVF